VKVLNGIKILEVANYISGPWAGQMLAEFGAEVIKIETPTGGDPFRSHTPDNYSIGFRSFNRHKKGVTLDLRHTEGKAIFRRLAASTDVVLENFRPGVMDKLGIGWNELRELNPKLIYCAISGFGPTGPYSDRPAYDTVIQAMSGLLALSTAQGSTSIAGPTFADSVSSLCAVNGIMGALFDRERRGNGCRVDVPMIDAMISFLTHSVTLYCADGTKAGPLYRSAGSQCFVFVCKDERLISVHLSTSPKFWQGLFDALGPSELATDTRFDTLQKRISRYEELGQALAPYFRLRDSSEWQLRLGAADVPYAPVNNADDLLADPQVQHLGSLFDVGVGSERQSKSTARPVFYNGTRSFDAAPAPILGEHTEGVLESLGFDVGERARLRSQGIV